MADTTQGPEKAKRRLRPSSNETMRERVEKHAASAGKPTSSRASKTLKPVRVAGKPFALFGRFFIPRYVRNSFKELREVTWPSWRISRQLTTAVIIFSVIFGIFISILDYGLDTLFKKVILKQ